MKLSDLQMLFCAYESALDFYEVKNLEDWGNPEEYFDNKYQAQQAVKDMKEFCEKNQITYNGIEIE